MADYQERRRLIRESLKIQPLSHGQVYTYTVGVRSQPEISPQRYEELRWSLENHNSNLIPIVVRRTDSLGGEKEYEAIYGADWVKVADDIGIETLWAWVFDLTDDEVKATQSELSLLLENPADRVDISLSNVQDTAAPKDIAQPQPRATENPINSVANLTSENLTQLLGSMLDQKMDQTLARLSNLTGVKDSDGGAIATLENKLEFLERRINHLTDAISNLAHSVESLKQRPAASRSTKKTVDLGELTAKLKQFRQDPSSIPADQLKTELNQKQVTKDQLQTWAKEFGLDIPKKMNKVPLIDHLLAR